jgi:hypothetical protein
MNWTGMEFDNFKVDGQMDQHTSRNALFKQTRLMFTTSLLQDKEELSSGMLTSHGLELLSMDPLSSYLSATFLTHLPNPTRKWLSCWVIIYLFFFFIFSSYLLSIRSKKSNQNRFYFQIQNKLIFLVLFFKNKINI